VLLLTLSRLHTLKFEQVTINLILVPISALRLRGVHELNRAAVSDQSHSRAVVLLSLVLATLLRVLELDLSTLLSQLY
jgi:hypothetical protein